MLRVQVFSSSVCSQRAKGLLFFQAGFKTILGFPRLPIQWLNYVPVVRAAVCLKLSLSHAASLPYHTATWVVSHRFLVLLVLAPWPGDCLSKNAGPHTAECWTGLRCYHEQVHGMSHEPRTSFRSSFWDHLQIIFLSPRDRSVKASEMQDSAEAVHAQKKDHRCYIHYIK